MRRVAIIAAFGCALASVATRSATLSGTVTRSDTGAPVSGAIVLVRGTDRHGQSDPNGSYTIGQIPAGQYGVSCSAPGLMAVLGGPVDLRQDARRDFSLDPPAADALTVSGRAFCDDSPCAGALVTASQAGQMVASGLSDASGGFSVSGLAAGSYDFWGIAHGHLADQVAAVSVSASESPSLELELAAASRTHAISGHVGLSENPLDRSGTSVRLYGLPADRVASTSAGGAYRIEGAPAGLLSLHASRPGYRDQLQIDVLVQGDRSLSFVLRSRDSTSAEPSYPVSGTVLLADPTGGNPFAATGSRVSLFYTDGVLAHTASTDSQGRYRIDGTAPGEVRVGAAREGYTSQVSEPFALTGEHTFDFVLELDENYDWGPGAGDGELGCASVGPASAQLTLVGLTLLLRLARNRRKR